MDAHGTSPAMTIHLWCSMPMRPVKPIAGLLMIGALLLMSSCEPEPVQTRPGGPTGTRQTLHPGDWQGAMGGTMIDFRIDQVTPGQVSVRISGTVIQPVAKGVDSYFYDRPKLCPKRADGFSFDCPHYSDMRNDNGLLCGTYTLNSLVYHPCFAPVR
jgi:hypothetical protein